VTRLIWDEHDGDEAVALLQDLTERLDELADEPDFLDRPVEILIERIRRELGLVDDEASQPVIARWRAAHPGADTS